MNKHKIFTIAFAFAFFAAAKAQKYSEIYNSLPNKTLDQAYSILMEYQRANPHWANTYLQLGMICEKKLIETDPLRDIQTAQYWADNAKLFFDTFGVFYSEGDARTNSEFYQNLDIPASEGRIQDADIKTFVAKHQRFCKNFRDSVTMAYQALEESKGYYNKCISTFKSICDNYGNLNDMLLRHNATLKNILDTLGSDIDHCVEAFARYKKTLEAYPIRDYRQTYEFKPIETFRLDGLTNSDFYMDRFTMWDYRKWIDDVNQTLATDILPLRQRIDDINRQYEQGKQEYENNSPFAAAAQEAYDELFIFQLGKYDNNSLVRELFSYLDDRRQLMLMAHDSLALPFDTSAVLLNRKMRHIYRFSEQLDETEKSLNAVGNSLTPDRIARFSEFFNKNYGGTQGLEKYVSTETAFLDKIFSEVLANFASYTRNVERQRDKLAYSVRGKGSSVPLWVVKENDLPTLKGPYITTHIYYNLQGNPEYVAGTKKNAGNVAFVAKIDEKNATIWLAELRNTEQIYNMSVNGSGCVLAAKQNGQSAIVYMNQSGKEIRKISSNENVPAVVDYDELANITYVAYNGADGGTKLCRIDEVNVWTVVLKSFERIENIIEVADGILVVGYNKGRIVCGRINNDGSIGKVSNIGFAGLTLDRIFRASAQDICLFTRDAQDKLQLTIVSDKGEVKITSIRQ